MTNDAQRIFRLEGLVRTLQNQVLALQTQVAQVNQNQATAATTSGGGGGGGGGAYYCTCPIQGINGETWSEFPVDVTQVLYSGNVSGSSGYVYNCMPDPCIAGYTLALEACGDGNYMATGQSCESP